jgi:hypothetical protein
MDVYISLLLGLVFLFAAWRSWKDVTAEITRDMLFDLRDEWRVFWSKTGRSFDEPIYARVRERLNQHLRYTKTFRFVGFLYYTFHIKKVLCIAKSIPTLSFQEDLRINKEIESISNRAVEAIRGYMFLSSLFLFPVLLGAVCYMVIKKTLAVSKALEKSIEKVSAISGFNRRFEPVIEASSFNSDVACVKMAIA